MGYAEKIYAQVKLLPDQAAKEVLDFAEFVAQRRAAEPALPVPADRALRRIAVEQTFSKYRIDLSDFKFDREEANARY